MRKRLKLILIPVLLFLFTIPFYGSAYTIGLLIALLMYSILAVSWNIFSGYTRYISLATAAFFGIGSYVPVLGWPELPFPVLVILGGVASSVFAFGVGFPCLRIRGPYFVILTLGLSELTKYIFVSYEINFRGMIGTHLLGGPSMEAFYYWLLAIAIIVILVDHFIRQSKFGLALSSIGGDEEAAEAMGVNTTRYKLLGFGISALFAGSVGAIIAFRWTYIEPTGAFNPSLTLQVIIMAIFGGTKDFRGPVLGAFTLTLVSEALGIRFPYYYTIILGLILILVIKFFPNGLLETIEKLVRSNTWETQNVRI